MPACFLTVCRVLGTVITHILQTLKAGKRNVTSQTDRSRSLTEGGKQVAG